MFAVHSRALFADVMKIAFVSNTDKPGRSGVGDYALGLASKLKEWGGDARILVLPQGDQRADWDPTKLLKDFRPDWFSFQFVPYAYAKRGMVGKRTLPWTSLRGRVRTHFMFHEIWIGSHLGAALRDQVIGFMQRRGIQGLIRTARPQVVHCSNRLYSEMLQRAGIQNGILPLFGNIPVSGSDADPYAIVANDLMPGSRREDWIVVTFFGSVYPSENLVSALDWLQNLSLGRRKYLLVVSLGHSPTADATFQRLGPLLAERGRPHFLIKGKLEAETLSSWIRFSDCGLATTPFNIIEKSGSAVAFAEHGVPVIVMDRGAPVRGITLPEQDLSPEFWLFGDERLKQWHELPSRRDPRPQLDQVARKFLVDLEAKS
jgi:glycosyltransferase involved in cell wall biosynthesis